jgi:hypothetical protein
VVDSCSFDKLRTGFAGMTKKEKQAGFLPAQGFGDLVATFIRIVRIIRNAV